MKSSKLLGRYVCRVVMALSVSFLLMEASSAANITKLFLTSGQVDLAREVVRLPLYRGRLSSGARPHLRRPSPWKPAATQQSPPAKGRISNEAYRAPS